LPQSTTAAPLPSSKAFASHIQSVKTHLVSICSVNYQSKACLTRLLCLWQRERSPSRSPTIIVDFQCRHLKMRRFFFSRGLFSLRWSFYVREAIVITNVRIKAQTFCGSACLLLAVDERSCTNRRQEWAQTRSLLAVLDTDIPESRTLLGTSFSY
jgi:hypothetical protein